MGHQNFSKVNAMLNEHPCGDCKHYYPNIIGESREARHGWCAAKSVFPHREGPGQSFPVGSKRAAEGKLAEPTIVWKSKIVGYCSLFQDK
jgi:hypothetical protein